MKCAPMKAPVRAVIQFHAALGLDFPARNQKAAEELAGTVSHQQSRQIEQVMTEVRKDDHKVELAEKTKKTIESILTDLDVGYKVRLPGADGICVGGWVGLVG